MAIKIMGASRRRRAGALVIGGAILAAQATAVFAHHSYTSWAPAYMTLKDVTVKDYEYTSPHIWVQVLVTDMYGNQAEWGLETGSPASMKQDGWTPNMLRSGDKITAIVHPKRDGSKTGSIVELDLASGQVKKVRDLVLLQPGNAPTCPPGQSLNPPLVAGGMPTCGSAGSAPLAPVGAPAPSH